MSSGLLGAALDKLSAQHFPQMTFLHIKDVTKEMLSANADPERSCKSLNTEQLDTLMKSVYVALANDAKNSTVYLKWHGAVYAAAGPGAVIRVLTDKPVMAA